MFNLLKNYSFFYILGYLIEKINIYLKSDFLLNYLTNNLISIEIALLAINISSSGIILSRLKEIAPEDSFSETIKEIKITIFEQIILIGLTLISFILLDTKENEFVSVLRDWLLFLINGIFAYFLFILFDISKSIFILIDFKK
ncbi:hypothetical protein NUH30_19160 [Leptospira sp. 85282-16]|uniref:hypothetical protein n=1 Tax=Leptospira sp. 85282-16 TaxID=2971256 RepID=UPI0021C1CAFD|nr:hypothetical protein [Leptospira sp. 85282-16]MCT8335814.1 hypothetical protein [Leptospira sp. 85282-16]